jgi:DNA-binding transcriptional MocR family regulator
MMLISFDRNKKEPIYIQIAQDIKDKILSAEFSYNIKLPSIRELAKDLEVSHMTVVKAYKILEKNKIVVKIRGKGIFVNYNTLSPNNHSEILSAWYSSIEDYQPRALTLSLLKNTLKKVKYNMSLSMLNSNMFLDVKKIFLEIINNQSEALMFYTEPSGDLSLKNSFIDYLSKYRGIETDIKNIIIVSGTQQGINLLASIFTSSKDLVMIESPTYTGAIDAFKNSGATIKPLPIHNNKLSINKLIMQCDKEVPKFIYLTPNYSNPSGYCLTKKERLELLEIAESFDFYIIEDDPWGELQTENTPSYPIKSYDKSDRVIYLKGISKILGAGYRVCAFLASENIISAMTRAKACADLGTALLPQRVVSEILKGPLIDNHIKKIEKFIKKRIHFTAQFFCDHLDSKVKYNIPKGGFNFWIILPEEVNTANILFEDAYNKGITFLPGAICYPSDLHHNEIRISITYLNDKDYEDALIELCKIINKRLK